MTREGKRPIAERRLRVSVVDDDDSCREAMAMLLEVLGHDVRVYPSVEALTEADLGLEADCLLLDATTPGATDPLLLDALRAGPTALPFIFVTGYAGEFLRQELFAFGAADCLHKPFEEEDLVKALERAVGSAEAGHAHG